MRKRVEYGPTTSKFTPDGMKTFTTTVIDPRGGYRIETKRNRHRTFAQHLGIQKTRYQVALYHDNINAQATIPQENKTVVLTRSRIHATNDGLLTILYQKKANRKRAAASKS